MRYTNFQQVSQSISNSLFGIWAVASHCVSRGFTQNEKKKKNHPHLIKNSTEKKLQRFLADVYGLFVTEQGGSQVVQGCSTGGRHCYGHSVV
jgi:hypothetical protein